MSTENHTERAHSALGASSASRWMNCPSSVSLIESLGLESTTSQFAEEGTAAHMFAEHCLVLEVDPMGVDDSMVFNGFNVNDEMREAVKIYVDYIKSKAESDFCDVLIEERFALQHIDESMFGTNDACIIEFGESIEIADLKYGKGVKVFADKNKQLMYYALGAYRALDTAGGVKKIILTVVQPRVEDPISTSEISINDLLNFEKELIAAVAMVKSGKELYKSGDHCRWCDAKAICPLLKATALQVAQVAFDEAPITTSQLPDPSTLSDEHLSYILDNMKLVEDWLKGVLSFASNRVMNNGYIPGYKLVEGRTQRKYRDDKEVIEVFEEKFGDKIYNKKLLGLGDMEKLVGKKQLEPFLIKPTGGACLVPESDKRQALSRANVKELFNDEPSGLNLDF